MLLVAVVVGAAKSGGDLPKGAGVLTALVAVDELAQARVAHPDDEHLADGRRQGGHPRVRHGVPVAREDECGAAAAPVPAKVETLLDAAKIRVLPTLNAWSSGRPSSTLRTTSG